MKQPFGIKNGRNTPQETPHFFTTDRFGRYLSHRKGPMENVATGRDRGEAYLTSALRAFTDSQQ